MKQLLTLFLLIFLTTTASSQYFYKDSLKYSESKAKKEAKKCVEKYNGKKLTFVSLPPHPVYKRYPLIWDFHSSRFFLLIGL